jgi:hypothetical protein
VIPVGPDSGNPTALPDRPACIAFRRAPRVSDPWQATSGKEPDKPGRPDMANDDQPQYARKVPPPGDTEQRGVVSDVIVPLAGPAARSMRPTRSAKSTSRPRTRRRTVDPRLAQVTG